MKLFKVLYSPAHSFCILYSLLSKATHMGSVPATITFSCQSATSILDANILLYAVFIDLNRCWLSSFVCFHDCQLAYFSYSCSVVYLSFCATAVLTAVNSVACTFVTCCSINTQYSNERSEGSWWPTVSVSLHLSVYICVCMCLSVCVSLSQDWLPGFPGLFTDASELARFFFLVFFFLPPKTPPSLASFKSRLDLPFWYRLTQVALEKRPLNGCSSSSWFRAVD